MPRFCSASNPVFRVIFLAVALCLLSASGAFAITYTSTASGNFHSPFSWTPLGIPGVGDDAVVTSGITLIAFADITVDELRIFPAATVTVNGPGLIEVQDLNIAAGGTLQGALGTHLYITAPQGATLTLVNDGAITGGPGGGSLLIHDGGSGGDLACPSGSSITSNGGSFQGGSPDGNVYMLAEDVNLTGATVAGGSGVVPCNGGSSVAGDVYVTGLNVNLLGGTVVTSGTNAFTGTCSQILGGSVKITAQSCNSAPGNLVVGPSATVAVGAPSSGPCPGALLYASGTSTLLGTIAAGPSGCMYWDPPELELQGDAELSGKRIFLSGDGFDASGLVTRTTSTPAISASDSLVISLNPGAVLDLQGLAPSSPLFKAGTEITLCVDDIKTSRGVELKHLMSPEPRRCEGRATFLLSLNPRQDRRARPGTTVSYPVQAVNASSVAADVELSVQDSQGWMVGGPFLTSRNLQPGETILLTVELEIPERARKGSRTQLKVVGQIPGQSPEQSGGMIIVSP